MKQLDMASDNVEIGEALSFGRLFYWRENDWPHLFDLFDIELNHILNLGSIYEE